MNPPEESNQSLNQASQHSCVRCFKRKVKCDKQRPCTACVRHNADCVFRVPNPRRPRKERTREAALTKRIEQYETVLRQSGVDPTSLPVDPGVKYDRSRQPNESSRAENSQFPTPESTEEHTREFSKPQLVHKHGRTKFLDNNLWTRVIEEIPDEDATFEDSSDDETDDAEIATDNIDFVLGIAQTPNNARQFHPSVEHISELWQVYVENVNPLIKLVHEPTLEAAIKKATLDLENVPRKLEALMFSIYSVAVLSLKDSDCEERFNEPRQTLLTRYRLATKTALSRAKFLSTSDIVILQAFMIHLISMPNVYNPHTLWALMGIASRLAEGMGLHRDGTHLGLPPFETEMRRRLWWQMRMFDMHNAELIGYARLRNMTVDAQLTLPPSNVDDDQLYPGMKTFPIETQTVSDMCFCSLVCELGHYWTKHSATVRAQRGKDASLWDNYESKQDIAEIDRVIDELEDILNNKYIRHCDPAQPAQLMTTLVARSGIKNMHFIAHHPRRWSSDESIPDSERKLVWDLCINMFEGEIMTRSNRQLERFSWHTSGYFPWAQVIHILDCLRANPFMDDATKAWRLIGEEFDYRREFFFLKKPIHIALGNLCLKAYNARESAFAKEGKPLGRTPPYITELRAQRMAATAQRGDIQSKTSQVDPSGSEQTRPHQDNSDPNNAMASSMSEVLPTNIGDVSMNLPQQSSYPIDLNNGPNQVVNDADLWSFDYASMGNPSLGAMVNSTTTDIDFLLDQGNNLDDPNVQAINWNQWDTLLADWNGVFEGAQ